MYIYVPKKKQLALVYLTPAPPKKLSLNLNYWCFNVKKCTNIIHYILFVK